MPLLKYNKGDHVGFVGTNKIGTINEIISRPDGYAYRVITMVAIMVRHARQTKLRFRRKDKWLPVFERIQQTLLTTSP